MPTIESRPSKGWGRVTTALGSDSMMCEACAGRHRYAKAGNRIIWVLGRPLIRVCLPCSRDMLAIWDEMLAFSDPNRGDLRGENA